MISGSVEKQDLSMPMEKASLYLFLTAGPPALLFTVVYFWIWGLGPLVGTLDFIVESPVNFVAAGVITIVLFALGIVGHELIHGLSYCLFAGKPLSTMKFGYQKETLTPYVQLREPIGARAYRLGVAMPGLLLGLIPSIIGVATGSVGMMLFGTLFLLGAGVDFLILWLIRGVEHDALVEDHPTNAGCYVIRSSPAEEADRRRGVALLLL